MTVDRNSGEVSFRIASADRTEDVPRVLDGAAGLGAVMLGWASDAAGRRGADALRLDCVRSNAGLRASYENRGFAHRGDVAVGGAPAGGTTRAPSPG
ncbi:hypothetical protein [Streptomyces sp. NPDC058664]|uniref:hypothetical protein n=1 Tax=unclassified Streptomyces TaxID=2593676 RepID=UPI003659BA87